MDIFTTKNTGEVVTNWSPGAAQTVNAFHDSAFLTKEAVTVFLTGGGEDCQRARSLNT